MPPEDLPKKPHIFLTTPASKNSYTSPRRPDVEFKLFERNREVHAQQLKAQLEQVSQQNRILAQTRQSLGIQGDFGCYLEFASEENFDLKFESLENQIKGIEIQNIRESDGVHFATVYVPEGQLGYFIKKVEDYRTELTKKGKFKNKTLIESISTIRMASLQSFWTDAEVDLFERIPTGEKRWWEIWLRTGSERETIKLRFIETATSNGIEVMDSELQFPERTILHIKASKQQIIDSVALLDCIAELRVPHDTAAFFMGLDAREQREWSNELLQRVVPPNDDSPAVCILDYGVNNSHPLIQPALASVDMHTYDPSWGVADNEGHGTNMAGLSLYGDLFDPLVSHDPIELRHRLESVKMLQIGQQHAPPLYGSVTQESVYRAEVVAAMRKRVICLSACSITTRDRGRPTSWSAAIDQLCSGSDNDNSPKRLICIAAGNLDFQDIKDYPNKNQIESIHDPGQSWNAITVGAYTDKISFDRTVLTNHIPVAPQGGLCPSSTTSLTWGDKWPNKPDVVLEGGNLARENSTGNTDYTDSLQLLTTYYLPLIKQFVTMGDTSAATALASRMAAIVQSQYPDFWPETIRGLIVHSASWSPEMSRDIDLPNSSQPERRSLLRVYGYGIPDIQQALWSASNDLTLIIQDSLQPFILSEGVPKTNEINLHKLPWPVKVLQELGELEITLKVTLSYFIEPNPSNRYQAERYHYPSHRLRFELKRATESMIEFQKRVNKEAREEDERVQSTADPIKWVIGSQLRNKGSIHSDAWIGSAADLASMDSIAIFPVTGWWRIRKKLEKYDSIARYSLLISIATPEEEIDIYTPVLNMIRPTVEVTSR
jgi:hypothetical protein